MKKFVFLAILSISLILGCATGPFGSSTDLYNRPYVTLIQDRSFKISINWVSSKKVEGELLYGISPSRMILSQKTPEGRYHQVDIVALKPNTLYYYTIDGGTTIHKFNTPKLEEDSVSIAIIGGGSYVNGDSSEAQEISKSIKMQHPDMIISFDQFLTYNIFLRPNAQTFRNFFPYSMEVPLLPGPSVNDYDAQNIEFLTQLFPSTYNPYGDYTIKYGELVRIVIINPRNQSTEHLESVRESLAEPFTGYTLVGIHSNPFVRKPSEDSRGDIPFWSSLMGIFYDLDTPFVFYGDTGGLQYYKFPFGPKNLHFWGTGGNGSVSSKRETSSEAGLQYLFEEAHYLMVYITEERVSIEVFLSSGEPLYVEVEPVQWIFSY